MNVGSISQNLKDVPTNEDGNIYAKKLSTYIPYLTYHLMKITKRIVTKCLSKFLKDNNFINKRKWQF